MSKILAKTLQQPEELVEGLIAKLEKLSGFAAHDLHFSSHSMQLLTKKTAELGLDSKDTNEEELYWALMHKFAEANDYFEKKYFNNQATSADKLKIIAGMASNSLELEKSWTLKSSVAKKLLRKNPPKVLQKQLGYRSLESMLKHEDCLVVLSTALSLCSSHWEHLINSQINRLTATDFEERTQKVVVLNGKWLPVINILPVVTSNALTGMVILSPNELSVNVPGLSLLVVTAQNLESNRISSIALRMPELSSPEHSFVARIGGAAISWNSLLFHLGKLHASDHPEIFEPHILAEHLSSLSISKRICSIHPILNFWKDSEYLLKGHGSKQVSANIVDVATNFANKSQLGSNTTQAGRSAYWNHLLDKYIQHPVVFDKIITDIEDTLAPQYRDNDTIALEYADVRSN